jgi:streptogramin lyase
MPEIGSVIGGMRIDSVAGRGGMGVVYRAHQLALDRTVALKIVNPELADDDAFRERFRREARLAASLDHAHVVPVFHAGEADGHLYIAMRFVEGTDLAKMIGEHGSIPPRDAAEIVAQIASALDAAHARGLVHRDVKPANFLVTRQPGRWHAYLTDFGITKDVRDSGLTQQGVAVGTLAYMSPEQLEGISIDGRADVYSLGCVLFHALTGQPPFVRDSVAALMYAHIHTPPPLLGGSLDPVIARALAKRPANRYATAGEFARDVLAAVTGGPDRAGPLIDSGARDPATSTPPSESAAPPTLITPPTLVGARPPGRRIRRWALVGAGAALVALVGVAVVQLVPTGEAAQGGPADASATSLGNPAGRITGSPIDVGAGPLDLVGGEGFIWTANTAGGSISRIDPGSAVSTEIVVDGQPNRILVGHGTAFAWNYSRSLTPVDVATGRVGSLIDTVHDITDLAAGRDSIWFAGADAGVVGRVDMISGTLADDVIDIGGRPSSISVGGGKVYVVDRENAILVTIDEASGDVIGDPLALPGGVMQVFTAGDTVYLLGLGGLSRLESGQPTSAEPIHPGVAVVAVGPDSAWMCDENADELHRVALDLRTPVAAPLRGVGAGCGDMEVVDGVLWFADRIHGAVIRIEPAPL